MKHAALRLVSRILWHAGVTSQVSRVAARRKLEKLFLAGIPLPRLTRRCSSTFQILVYHRINREPDPFYDGTTARVLQGQIETLQGTATIMDLADLVSKLRERKPIPANAIALTFDDGYRDNYEVAFPILQKYGVPATIFLTTSFIDQREVPWNDKVTFALKHTPHKVLTFKYHDQEFCYPLGDIADRLKARDQVLWLLRHVAHEDKLRLVDEITRSLSVTDFDYLWKKMLTWDQVKAMHRRGIGFGAHTITHPILTRLPVDEARQEIEGSKRAIEKAIGAPVALFAYPAGTRTDVNDAIKEVVRRSGFQGAVTTIFGFNSPETDPYSLRRGGSADPNDTLFALQQAYYKLVN